MWGFVTRCDACRYNRLAAQNATSLSRRFTRLHGLQPLLLTELSAMDTARKASLTTLSSLTQRCGDVTQAFVDQVLILLLPFMHTAQQWILTKLNLKSILPPLT